MKDRYFHTLLPTEEPTDKFIEANKVSLIPKEFNQFLSDKKKKFFNKNKTTLITTVLYITTSIISFLYFKPYTYYRRPFFASYLQTSSLIFYLPFSFIIKVIGKVFIKNPPPEMEKTSAQMAKSLSDNFSDLLEKKYYENYYYYYRKFHLNTLILSILHYSSLCFFYWGILYIQPLFANVLISPIPLFIIGIKFCFRGINFTYINLASIAANIFIVVFLGIYYFLSQNMETIVMPSKGALGIIFIILSYLAQGLFFKLFRKMRRRYKFYIDVNEVIGFIGLFVFLPIPIILLLMHYFSVEPFYIPDEFEFLEKIGEAIFTGVITDFLMIRSMQYLKKLSFSNTYSIIYGLIYLWYWFEIKKNKNGDSLIVLFITGECFVVILIVLSFFQYFREKREHKKKRKRGRKKRLW